ncbi:MAG: cyclic nucleotide-binding domain-containing protein, partial [Simkaniaceae bacterium]|nr:cyclic nucleotide-binding domain-containing protein [Simkaniaceae bacterium]
DDIRVLMIHSKNRLMDRELSPSLGVYAAKILQKRGVEIRFEERLITATPEEAILESGERILSKTIISTVPSSPNPLIQTLPLPNVKGKIKVGLDLLVEGQKKLWALGDCALIPHAKSEGFCPPTAQFAIREAKVLARNIVASIDGKKTKIFKFEALGMLGALGHKSAVAQLFGCLKFSGWFAWLLWRLIYWMKLPGFGRKVKVGLSWLLDTLIPIEPVQLKISPTQGIAQLHFETGENIFHEGDFGDYLYIIIEGTVEILKKTEGKQNLVCTLGKGEFFGEMALLNQKSRNATVRCKTAVDVIALRKQDFGLLIANFCELRESFEKTTKERGESKK